MNSQQLLLSLMLVAVSTPLAAQIAADETLRHTATLPSPWGEPLGAALPVDTKMRLGPRTLEGPAPLECSDATHLFVRTAAPGLFEGNLPAPAERSAKALGLPANLVTQRIVCANGSFDLHRAADGRAWIGLDNAILQWERLTIADSVEATVQALLVQHFAGDFEFSAATVAAQSQLLTRTLLNQLRGWFKRAKASNEAPALNGDPYTDSQEPPDSFELAPPRIKGRRAELTVMYRGERRDPRLVHVQLLREQGAWRVSDVRYQDDQTLSQLLAR